jgi:DNA-binding GntR family transcriptional regulator
MDAITPQRSLVDQTYEAILKAICSGDLRPGDRLAQDEIAAQLNVSRQPVNSAIAMLKSQRFVIETGRRGVVVARVDQALFEAIYQVRSALEPLAVELATPRLTPQVVAEGMALVAHGTARVAEGDAAGVLDADIAFHSLIYRLSGNQIIDDTMQLNWQHLRRSMGEVLRFPGMSAQVWQEHGQIFAAMAQGDAATAANLMRSHMTDAALRVRYSLGTT